MSEFPPPVRETEFSNIETRNKESIRSRFDPFVRELHSFLNETSCLSDVHRIRRRWSPRSTAQRTFKEFVVEPEHWYTYNAGGRNEAQFNVGMFPDYLRVGLGFEFTRGGFGEPDVVQPLYRRFREVIGQHEQIFERFVQQNSLQVEWLPERKKRLEYVSTGDVTKWLLRRPPKVPDWIFIGRLLRRGKDAEILEEPVQLKEVMESMFGSLKPLWEQTQTGSMWH